METPRVSLTICTSCGTMNSAVKRYSGSILIEIVLWLFFIIPGLVYSLHRITTGRVVCRKCGGQVVPATSPVGRRLCMQYHGRVPSFSDVVCSIAAKFVWAVLKIGLVLTIIGIAIAVLCQRS